MQPTAARSIEESDRPSNSSSTTSPPPFQNTSTSERKVTEQSATQTEPLASPTNARGEKLLAPADDIRNYLPPPPAEPIRTPSPLGSNQSKTFILAAVVFLFVGVIVVSSVVAYRIISPSLARRAKQSIDNTQSSESKSVPTSPLAAKLSPYLFEVEALKAGTLTGKSWGVQVDSRGWLLVPLSIVRDADEIQITSSTLENKVKISGVVASFPRQNLAVIVSSELLRSTDIPVAFGDVTTMTSNESLFVGHRTSPGNVDFSTYETSTRIEMPREVGGSETLAILTSPVNIERTQIGLPVVDSTGTIYGLVFDVRERDELLMHGVALDGSAAKALSYVLPAEAIKSLLAQDSVELRPLTALSSKLTGESIAGAATGESGPKTTENSVPDSDLVASSETTTANGATTESTNAEMESAEAKGTEPAATDSIADSTDPDPAADVKPSDVMEKESTAQTRREINDYELGRVRTFSSRIRVDGWDLSIPRVLGEMQELADVVTLLEDKIDAKDTLESDKSKFTETLETIYADLVSASWPEDIVIDEINIDSNELENPIVGRLYFCEIASESTSVPTLEGKPTLLGQLIGSDEFIAVPASENALEFRTGTRWLLCGTPSPNPPLECKFQGRNVKATIVYAAVMLEEPKEKEKK